jgi:hypothetical protein
MSTSPGDPGGMRIGTAEREAAIAALGEHWRAGRLDPAEHEARTTKAFAAVTKADLDALFADLPPLPSDPPGSVRRDAPGAGPPGSPLPARGGPIVPEESAAGRRRDVLMALTPFVCLVLFFTVARTWLVWLIIPVVAILLYGTDGKKGGRDRR